MASIFSPGARRGNDPREIRDKKRQTRDASERRALIERRRRCATREINIALNQPAEKREGYEYF